MARVEAAESARERQGGVPLAALLAACGAAFAALVAIPEYLPLTDLPQHVAQHALWLRLEDGRHELNLVTPYALPHLLAHAAAAVLGPEGGVRLALWAGAAAFPLAAVVFLRAFGRPPELALAAAPAALSFSFWSGYVTYVAALPLVLLGAAAARRSALGSRRAAAALAAIGLVAVAAHGFVVVVLGAFALLAAAGPPWRALPARAARATLPLAPAAAALALWSARAPPDPLGAAPGLAAATLRLEHALPSVFGGTWTNPRAVALALASIALWALARGVPPGARAGDERGRRDLFWPAAAGLAALALFPHEVRGIWGLYERFAPVAWVAFVGAWPWPAEPRRRRALTAAAAAFALASAGTALVEFHRFGDEARGMRELARALPAGRRVLWSACGDEVHGPTPAFQHFAAYYQVERGGDVSGSFAAHPHMVVRYRRGAALTARERGEPAPVDPAEYDLFIAREGPLCPLPELLRRGPLAVRGRFVALRASALDPALLRRLWDERGEDRLLSRRW